jgi:hypothetical protein
MDDKVFDQKMAILNLAAELGGINIFDPSQPHEDKIEKFFSLADRIEKFVTASPSKEEQTDEQKRKAFLASLDSSTTSCGNGGCANC